MCILSLIFLQYTKKPDQPARLFCVQNTSRKKGLKNLVFGILGRVLDAFKKGIHFEHYIKIPIVLVQKQPPKRRFHQLEHLSGLGGVEH